MAPPYPRVDTVRTSYSGLASDVQIFSGSASDPVSVAKRESPVTSISDSTIARCELASMRWCVSCVDAGEDGRDRDPEQTQTQHARNAAHASLPGLLPAIV